MIDLQPTILAIKRLIDDGSAASLTYAALECRLAIERICYERLRLAHEYISHADLRRWQPKDVVQTLIAEVDESAASTYTWAISADPPKSGLPEPTKEDYESMEFHTIGTQVGFDPKKLGRLWYALAKLALHVSLPESKDDFVNQYGDAKEIKAKVSEAITEIERISHGTLIASGMVNPETISFSCYCGATTKRRVGLLRDSQKVSCIIPECPETFQYDLSGSRFTRRTFNVVCAECQTESRIPLKKFELLSTNERLSFDCEKCNKKIYIGWYLQVSQEINSESEDKTD